MIRGDQFRSAIVEKFAAKAGDSLRGVEERLRGAGTEAADDFGRDHIELADQIWRAGGDLILFGKAIFGRAAFDDVADVDVGALEAHGFDHLREKFAGAADEWLALFVFVAAGAFADEDELRFRIADTEDDVGAGLVKFAASAIGTNISADAVERVVFDAIGGFEE